MYQMGIPSVCLYQSMYSEVDLAVYMTAECTGSIGVHLSECTGALDHKASVEQAHVVCIHHTVYTCRAHVSEAYNEVDLLVRIEAWESVVQ